MHECLVNVTREHIFNKFLLKMQITLLFDYTQILYTMFTVFMF